MEFTKIEYVKINGGYDVKKQIGKLDKTSRIKLWAKLELFKKVGRDIPKGTCYRLSGSAIYIMKIDDLSLFIRPYKDKLILLYLGDKDELCLAASHFRRYLSSTPPSRGS